MALTPKPTDTAMNTIVTLLIVFVILLQHVDCKQCSYRGNGICVDLNKYYCPAGYKIEERGCGFKETCCYPTVQGQPKFVYGNDKCGVTSRNWGTKIVGGKDTYISEFPWTVSIQKSNQHVCGGSIISDQWILTAAHCVIKHASTITVVVGSSYSRLPWDSFTERHQVSSIIKHGKYVIGRAVYGYDIAIIKLRKPLSLGGSMTRKVCLPDDQEDFTDQVCVATGWGHTKEPIGPAKSKDGSPILRKATLPVISKSRCVYYTGTRSKHTICAGYSSGGEDTCQGDSGGPLVCQGKDGVWKQAGIVSTGRGCGRSNAMGIYTQVSGFIKWIQDGMDMKAD